MGKPCFSIALMRTDAMGEMNLRSTTICDSCFRSTTICAKNILGPRVRYVAKSVFLTIFTLGLTLTNKNHAAPAHSMDLHTGQIGQESIAARTMWD